MRRSARAARERCAGEPGRSQWSRPFAEPKVGNRDALDARGCEPFDEWSWAARNARSPARVPGGLEVTEQEQLGTRHEAARDDGEQVAAALHRPMLRMVDHTRLYDSRGRDHGRV